MDDEDEEEDARNTSDEDDKEDANDGVDEDLQERTINNECPPLPTNQQSTSPEKKRKEMLEMLKDDASEIHLISGRSRIDWCSNMHSRHAMGVRL